MPGFTKSQFLALNFDRFDALAQGLEERAGYREEAAEYLLKDVTNPQGGKEFTGEAGRAAQGKGGAISDGMRKRSSLERGAGGVLRQAGSSLRSHKDVAKSVLDAIEHGEEKKIAVSYQGVLYSFGNPVVGEDWKVGIGVVGVAIAVVPEVKELVDELLQADQQDLDKVLRELEAEADNQASKVAAATGFDDVAKSDDPLAGETFDQAQADAKAYADGTADEATRKRIEAAMRLSPQGAGQLAEGQPATLGPQQGALLQALQQQLSGKSPADIKALADKYSPSGGKALGNALEMMDNPNIRAIPPGGMGSAWQGGADKLPQKVKEAVDKAGVGWHHPDPRSPVQTAKLQNGDGYKDLCAVIGQADPSVKQNTGLDKAISDKALQMLHAEQHPPNGFSPQGSGADDAIQAGLAATAADHQVVHDTLRGKDGRQALDDITGHSWEDKGYAAGAYLNQSANADAGGAQGRFAGESERTIADYLAAHPELKKPENMTFGQVNPGLAQGLAQGLAPYIADMTGVPMARHYDSFGVPMDTDTGTDQSSGVDRHKYPKAESVIALLSTGDEAAKTLQGAAVAHEIAMISAAQSAAEHSDSTKLGGYLDGAEQLRAITDKGLTDGLKATYADNKEYADHEKQIKSGAWDIGKKFLSEGVKLLPYKEEIGVVLELAGGPLKDWLTGTGDPHPVPGTPTENTGEFRRMVASVFLAKHPEVGQGNPLITSDGHILTRQEWQDEMRRSGKDSAQALYENSLKELLNGLSPGLGEAAASSENLYRSVVI